MQVTLASPGDDAALRQLMRDTPMHGGIRLGFSHEPGYFSGMGIGGALDRILVARENGNVVAAGRCTTQLRHINGQPRSCAYLGGLRLDRRLQGRAGILRAGYSLLGEEIIRTGAELCFTSIFGDNTRARRVLERGFRGMPRYQPLGELVTLVLPVPRSYSAPRLDRDITAAQVQVATGADVPAQTLVDFLNNCGRTKQLSVFWSVDQLATLPKHGLGPRDFILLRRGASIVAAAAIWDQRAFRQIVVHGYSQSLSALRPLINLAAFCRGRPPLPAPGAVVAQGFLSPIAVGAGEKALMPLLIEISFAQAAGRGLDYLSMSSMANDPWFSGIAARFPHRRQRSILYSVQWPDHTTGNHPQLDDRPLLPETALL